MSGQQPWEPAQPSDWSTGDGDWESVDHQSSTIPATLSGPPLAFLVMSGGLLAVAALLLLFARREPWASGAAWLLAGPVNVLCIGAFLGEDTRRRAETWYAERSWANTLYKALLVIGIIIAIAASWFFADWAARQ